MTSRQPRSWNDWGELDPYWAILSRRDRRGSWDVEEFFRSGDDDVAVLMQRAAEYGYPEQRGRALDYGCGVGRITRALAAHFAFTLGVDVAPTMVARAQELHRDIANVEFREAATPAELTDAGRFDLVWCILVLQHLGSVPSIEEALRGLCALVAPQGLIVVEIPAALPPPSMRDRLHLRTRTYEALRTLGVRPAALHRHLHLMPEMSMTALSERRARSVFGETGIDLLDVDTRCEADGIDYRRYFGTRPAATGRDDVASDSG
jgi:SAM-dependent methyltransferase